VSKITSTFTVFKESRFKGFNCTFEFSTGGGGGGNDIVDPGRTGYAIFFGFVLVAMTLIFALIHKFKYKR
jgi:hypothetical protein